MGNDDARVETGIPPSLSKQHMRYWLTNWVSVADLVGR